MRRFKSTSIADSKRLVLPSLSLALVPLERGKVTGMTSFLLTDVLQEKLLQAARAARSRAYAPYSRFRVGAAVLDAEGRIHAGCNVENAAYPEGVCAEAAALSAMVLPVAAGCALCWWRVPLPVHRGPRPAAVAARSCASSAHRRRRFSPPATMQSGQSLRWRNCCPRVSGQTTWAGHDRRLRF